MFNPAKEIFSWYEVTNEERERSQSHHPSGLCALKRNGKYRESDASESTWGAGQSSPSRSANVR